MLSYIIIVCVRYIVYLLYLSWFADSGATQHISDQTEWLQNFVPVPEGSWSVNGIGSSSYPARGYGDAHVWTTTDNQKKPATIKKVLYVPGLGTNLFSIAAVTDLGWKATFTGTRVLFTTDQGDTVMAGERVGRTLYLLDVRPRSHQGDQQSLAFASSISPGLATWHRRLAHIIPKTIIKMASNGVVKGLDLACNDIPSEPCAGCQYDKHQRSLFPVGRKRAIYSGQLIHSDICGPKEKATPRLCHPRTGEKGVPPAQVLLRPKTGIPSVGRTLHGLHQAPRIYTE